MPAVYTPRPTWVTRAPRRPGPSPGPQPAGGTDTAVLYDHRGSPRGGPQVAGAFAALDADPPPPVAPPPLAPPSAPPPADAVRPVVVGVDLPGPRLYRRGEWLTFTVRFSEPVQAAGGPRLLLRVGGGLRFAALAGGSGSTALVFRYRVAAADVAPRGIAVIHGIGLPGGAAIRNAAGNPAVVVLPPLATAGIRLDGRFPPRIAR